MDEDQRALVFSHPDKRGTQMQTPHEETNEFLATRKISVQVKNPDEEILIYRCLKTACHEICHVLGMTHCPYFECLMNGSNLVTEADKKPFALCPICLRKLEKYCEI